ncbi:protein-L-isoaspartate(D-aspartate) O-methyltransferase [Streptomyces sp. SAJ15]|nr:protein-L-isoaspartate(D-aspartate) O-methyltransferase [Streptomyces sp. SAJ15]
MREAYLAVPRHAFVPDLVWVWDESAELYRALRRSQDEDRWHTLVYAREPVVTQVDDGVERDTGREPTSSLSAPGAVFAMLGASDLDVGMRVLEIGTGTGYNAALLSEWVGAENVTTIEVDSAVFARARAALNGCGYRPTAVHANGEAGYQARAPYDRLLSTAAVRRIPRAWLEQVRTGGVIVTPFGTAYRNAGLLRLDVDKDATASGQFVDSVDFMWVRGQRPSQVRPRREGEPRLSASPIAPQTVTEAGKHAEFAMGLRVPGVRSGHLGTRPDGTYRLLLWDTRGSYASVHYAGWRDGDGVLQHGPRDLWDELVAAHTWWDRHGRPPLTRFGLTVSPSGEHQVWLNSPDGPTWELRDPREI